MNRHIIWERLRLVEHIVRMEETKSTYKILVKKCNGNRSITQIYTQETSIEDMKSNCLGKDAH
jgi:hypothetical protein